MRSKFAGAIAACAIVFLLTSCSSGGQDPRAIVLNQAEQARAAGSEANAKAMEDGELTEGEYYAAARRYQECYREQGIVLPEPVLSPVDNVTLEWDFPDTAMSSGKKTGEALETCTKQWTPVSLAYGATHDQHTDPLLLDATRECLKKEGFDTPDDAVRVADLIGDPNSDSGKQSTAAEKCLIAEAFKLYPDLPAVTVQY
ncbi:hypothetical protein AB0301_14665 [Microbacterium profundi]|uniref:Lipoprotein n=1 Tax=Microbacterium profundi TaxID=450380 RepID=A0ABV3LK54_9MICO